MKEVRDKFCRLENNWIFMFINRNKIYYYIKDIFVELFFILNDLLEWDVFGNNDLCGWF